MPQGALRDPGLCYSTPLVLARQSLSGSGSASVSRYHAPGVPVPCRWPTSRMIGQPWGIEEAMGPAWLLDDDPAVVRSPVLKSDARGSDGLAVGLPVLGGEELNTIVCYSGDQLSARGDPGKREPV